jgi:hypothetical protein
MSILFGSNGFFISDDLLDDSSTGSITGSPDPSSVIIGELSSVVIIFALLAVIFVVSSVSL